MTRLLDLVDQLTRPQKEAHKQQVRPGYQQTITSTMPSLLDQLEAAIHSSASGRAGGTSDPASRGVLNSGAYALYTAIKHEVDEWCFWVNVPKRDTPSEALRAWYVSTLTVKDDDFAWQESHLRGWIMSIRAMLNPNRVVEILDPCPLCGAGTWVDENGDRMLNPVTLSYPPGVSAVTLSVARVTCRACKHEWRGLSEVRAVAFDMEQARAQRWESGRDITPREEHA